MYKAARAQGLFANGWQKYRQLAVALVPFALGWGCSEVAPDPVGSTAIAGLEIAGDSGMGTPRFGSDTENTNDTPERRAADGESSTIVDATSGAEGATSGSNCDFPAAPKQGDPGASCQAAGDCDSGYCIEGPSGKICTKTCSDCCPTGFACEAASSTDPQFVCRAKLNALCRPCEKDSECIALSIGSLCVSAGIAGRFCGGNCNSAADCYNGYNCVDAKGTEGAGKQCVKSSGECSCSPQMVLDGAKTSCSTENGYGACKGERKCTTTGLSACDAATAATESCDGADNDCDGAVDEENSAGCQQFYSDMDLDGAGDLGSPGKCLCKPAEGYTAIQNGDCDDNQPKVKPGATELCNGVDDDCDGTTDSGFPDTDGDLQADCVDPDIDNDGVANPADCAPANVKISPAATETCNNIDDNCNGSVDEPGAVGCKNLYFDSDGDGFGKPLGADELAQCLCKADGKQSALTGDDCEDKNAQVNPQATEVCNDKDDNCDSATDEGCDDDLDGFCDGKLVVVGKPAVCALGEKDCDDLNAAISPGNKEVCATTVDENCDGVTDAGVDAKECVTFYKDADKDGFGAGAAQCLCSPEGAVSATNNKDCNDNDALMSPAKPEKCGNGVDDNCNGEQDDEDAIGCEPWYTDADGDGYGANTQACLCGATQTFSTNKGGDCEPKNQEISPGAAEICNGIDDNCLNGIDESGAKGCTVYYADKDSDGIGDSKLSKCLCKADAPYTSTSSGDCDDTKAASKPGATETCDGVDNDCNGQTDEMGAEGCKVVYIDKDGDKFGAAASGACLCALGGEYNAIKGGDCNDGDIAIFPAAQEFCDGQDNNCNNSVDEENAIGCVKYLKDGDKDGYGVSALGKCLCKPSYPFTEFTGGDCNDEVATVNPKMAESCDSIDNNCDGQTDPSGSDGCSPFFLDKDQDGYGTYLAAPKCLCDAKAPYTTAVSGDCNDNDPNTYPKSAEFCDGKDTDCDGIIDPKGAQGCKPYYIDGDNDGYGSNNLSQCLCNADAPFTTTKGGDCNDGNGNLNPGAQEQCNTLDDNCNGQTDEGAAGGNMYYIDNDNDGFGVGVPVMICGGPKPPYQATKGGDCNDSNNKVYPTNTEIQCNGIDDDCVGGELCLCQSVKENFESGTNGWSLGSGWVLGAWAGQPGTGAGYGNGGSSYCTITTAASSLTKAIAIPATATKLTFWYRYSPDPTEYGGFDGFSVNFGGTLLVNKTAGTKGSTTWQQATYDLPSGWAGTSKVFTATFNCLDGAFNAGFGAAVDEVSITCN